MLKIYTYNKQRNVWIQEDQVLLLHDVGAIVDEKNNILYIWKGPKAKKEKIKSAKETLDVLLSKYPIKDFNVKELVPDKLPEHIKLYLEELLDPIKTLRKSEKYKFSKLITLRAYLLLTILILGLIFLYLGILSSSLFWPIQNNTTRVSEAIYLNWVRILQITNFVIFLLLISQLVLGIFEKDPEVKLFSIVGLMISIGIMLYLNQGVFLFLFQNGNDPDIYEILFVDLLIFIIINYLVIMIIFLLSVYKLYKFIKTYREFLF
jgi:hypothetical protein